MAEYTIAIQNRIATAEPGILLICNNPTDTIRFEFDEEWSDHEVKTARFSWDGKYIDRPFTGDVVQVPEIYRTNHVYIGVFTDSITSAPTKVNCRYSIKCHGGNPAPPSQDVYEKIMRLINQGNGSNPTSTFHKKEEEVYCYPVEGTELRVISHISPVQEVGTENLLPSNWSSEWNGISYTWNSDGSLTVSGTAAEDGSAYALVGNASPITLEKGTYVFSVGAALPVGLSIIADAYEDAANWVGYSGEYSFTLSDDSERTFEASGEHEYAFTLNVAGNTTVNMTIIPRLVTCETKATRNVTLQVANGEKTQQYSAEFDRDVFNGTYDWNSGKLTDLDAGAEYAYKSNEIKALSGLNIIKADTGIVEVEGYASDGRSAKMQEYNHMPRLYLYGDTSAMTKDDAVMLRFKYDGADNYIYASAEAGIRENGAQYDGWLTAKWQGSSSVSFPKKNYTFTFYLDENGEGKRDIQLRSEWGAHSKYCAKANFIDPTHCRNVVAAKLWGECVRSRNQASESYIRMNALPNAGAVDGYPMLIFINDKYQGIYTMNIPKADWMFGMNDGEATNTVLCGEDYSTSAMFYGAPVIDGTDWSYEVEPADKSGVLASFGAIYNAVSMPETSDAEKAAKKAALEACVDIYSVIDYEIFLGELGLSDNNGKNQLLVTYDGAKWIMCAYDLDTAFGNHWTGTKYRPCDQDYDYGNGLTWAVRLLYPDEYAARKAELKNGCLSKANILDKLMNFGIDIPQEAYRAESELWPDMCGANANAMQQIVSFVLAKA